MNCSAYRHWRIVFRNIFCCASNWLWSRQNGHSHIKLVVVKLGAVASKIMAWWRQKVQATKKNNSGPQKKSHNKCVLRILLLFREFYVEAKRDRFAANFGTCFAKLSTNGQTWKFPANPSLVPIFFSCF